jgi:hypothetical protein
MARSCGNCRWESPIETESGTATESHRRINSEKEAKKNRGVKAAAKKMIKKKVLKKMPSYFGKKQIMIFSSLTLSAVSWCHHHDHHSIVLATSALMSGFGTTVHCLVSDIRQQMVKQINSVVKQELDVHPLRWLRSHLSMTHSKQL